jgi:hypothetical protein
MTCHTEMGSSSCGKDFGVQLDFVVQRGGGGGGGALDGKELGRKEGECITSIEAPQ